MSTAKRFLVMLPLLAAMVSSTLVHAMGVDCRDTSNRIDELVPDAEITSLFIGGTGNWTDESRWSTGHVPTSNDRVLIPQDAVVTLRSDISNVKLETLRIDGVLIIDGQDDTALSAVTIVVKNGGTFTVGERDAPVAPDARARITFAARKADSDVSDPCDLRGGLLVQQGGRFEVYGAKRTSYAIADIGSVELRPGASEIKLVEHPSGWEEEDKIVVPGLYPWRENENRKGRPQHTQDEEFAIKSVDGDMVSLGRESVETDYNSHARSESAMLQHDHMPPLVTGVGNKPLEIPVINLNRNVIFESENTERFFRAHILLANRTPPARIEYAGFYNLGRTDAKFPAVSPNAEGDSSNAWNIKGRYPIHVHQPDMECFEETSPHTILGSAVVGSLKHGMVNHGGHVNMIENVGFDNAGSHFFMENGQELGVVAKNVAIFSSGSNKPTFNGVADSFPHSRNNDFGHAGHGFWGHGGGVIFYGNFAFSHAHAAFIVYPLNIGERFEFPTQKLLHNHVTSLDASLPEQDDHQALADELSGAPYYQQFVDNRRTIYDYVTRPANRAADQENDCEPARIELQTPLTVADVPIYTADNVGVSSLDGMRIGFHLQPGQGDGKRNFCLPYYPCDIRDDDDARSRVYNAFRSHVIDSQFWNNRRNALFYGYAMLARLNRLTLVAPLNYLDILANDDTDVVGIGRNDNDLNGHNQYEHILAMGFDVGIKLPLQGTNYANDIRLMDNEIGLHLQTAAGPREITMINVEYFHNVQKKAIGARWYQGGSVGDLFYKDQVTINGERAPFPHELDHDGRSYKVPETLLINLPGQEERFRNSCGIYETNVRLRNRCQRFGELKTEMQRRRVYVYDENGAQQVVHYENKEGWQLVPLDGLYEPETCEPLRGVLVYVGDIRDNMLDDDLHGFDKDTILPTKCPDR